MKYCVILHEALSSSIGKHVRWCPGLELAVIILGMCVQGAPEGPWKGGEDSPGPGEQVFEVHVCLLVRNSFLPSSGSFSVASGSLLLFTIGYTISPANLFISPLRLAKPYSFVSGRPRIQSDFSIY